MSEIKNLEVYKMKSGLKVMMVSEGNDFGQTCAGVLRSILFHTGGNQLVRMDDGAVVPAAERLSDIFQGCLLYTS